MPMMMRTERIYRSRAGTSTPRGTNTVFCDFAISLRVKKKKNRSLKNSKGERIKDIKAKETATTVIIQ